MRVAEYQPARVLGAALLLAMALVFGTSGAMSAAEDGPALELSKSTDLDPAGEEIAVKGSGFQPDISLFVVACDPAIPAGGACDMANFGQASTDADGAFDISIKVMAAFGQTDCMKTPCAIQTSKVGDGKDRSQEATAHIGFAGGVPKAEDSASNTSASNDEPAASGTDKSSTDKAATSDDSGSSAVMIGVIAAIVIIGGGAIVVMRRRGSSTNVNS